MSTNDMLTLALLLSLPFSPGVSTPLEWEPAVLRPIAEFTVAANRNAHAYLGNLHGHTKYSDGRGTPDEAYDMARNQAKLDFLAITEHNHAQAEAGAGARQDGLLIATDHSLYNGPGPDSLINSAKRKTRAGHFVALYGQEFSSISKGNHVNVFDAPSVIDAPNGRFDRLLEWIDEHPDSTGAPCVLQFNHPKDFTDESQEYGADDFGSRDAWIERMGRHASLIEIMNGPGLNPGTGLRPTTMERDFLEYLSLGFRLAPTGDQDNHFKNWGLSTDARTGLVANTLSKSSLLKAMRGRHAYATEDKDLRIVVWIQKALAGDEIPRPSASADVQIALRAEDADEPDVSYRIEVFTGQVRQGPAQVVGRYTAIGNSAPGQVWTLPAVHVATDASYLFLKVTQIGATSNDRAWVAPVWFR